MKGFNFYIIVTILIWNLVSGAQVCYAQFRLVIDNGGYIVMNGGTSSTPLYLAIENDNPNAITRNASGHIISENEYNYVKWNAGATTGSYAIPFGYNNTDYLPLTITKTTAGNPASGYLLTSTYATASDNTPWSSDVGDMNNAGGFGNELNVLDRWWIIDASSYSTTKPNADMAFTYRDATEYAAPNTITETSLQVQRWNSTIGAWGDWGPAGTQNTNADPNTDEVTVTGVTGANFFRSWVLVDNVSPLPIELLDFTAVLSVNQQVLCQWSTSTEINNDYFTVERSIDGKIFSQIGTVKGAGNSSTTLYYEFIDHQLSDLLPFTFKYYRLKQTNYNGQNQYFGPISFSMSSNFESFRIISMYPNPAEKEINAKIAVMENTEATVEVMNVLGEQVVSRAASLKKGRTEISINTEPLAQGNYIFKVILPNKEHVQKMFVK